MWTCSSIVWIGAWGVKIFAIILLDEYGRVWYRNKGAMEGVRMG
jgi:hypothetical protein